MKKFNIEDWEIDVEQETGNDDYIYGNYVDWDEFRTTEEENLLSYFEVDIPWGKEISCQEFFDFLSQEVFYNTSIINSYPFEDLQIIETGPVMSDLLFLFPSRKDLEYDMLVSDIFDYCEVPSGTAYEDDLPQELQFWYSMMEEEFLESEYEYYKNYPLGFANFNESILDIKSKMSSASDTLTKKSLLLSSFIISESLYKSTIVSKIPTENNISEFSKEILSKSLGEKLRGSVDTRNQLFKKIFNVKSPKQEWIVLRNSLSHDIESSKLVGDCISYINLKDGKEYTENIYDLFKKQIIFYEELKCIVETDNEK